ncbi:protein PIF [Octopus bimaculoides]|nr:protein PIF [Octopus bimaculoides]
MKDDHEQGKDDHEQGKDDHEQGKDDHEQGKDDHEQGKDDHEQGKDDHEQGKDDHEQGKDDHEQGKDDHEQGKDDHEQGKDDYEQRKDVQTREKKKHRRRQIGQDKLEGQNNKYCSTRKAESPKTPTVENQVHKAIIFLDLQCATSHCQDNPDNVQESVKDWQCLCSDSHYDTMCTSESYSLSCKPLQTLF